jgi:hypothetical protein
MTRAAKPRRGRPPGTGRGLSDLLKLRVTGAEKASYEQAAKDATVSAWARAVLNAAAARKAS